ncbi:hypothetical protein T492DRAFT_858585 [Pavlovales sp. CCMP2436]|nr:hypothetical protein T492DRAFT_858585 [Pavlovales sp. CCMP2436]
MTQAKSLHRWQKYAVAQLGGCGLQATIVDATSALYSTETRRVVDRSAQPKREEQHAGGDEAQLPDAVVKVRPVKVRDYMYSRKGAPPILVKAHHHGLPNSKAADVTSTGAVIDA